jgi:hypothetical protein
MATPTTVEPVSCPFITAGDDLIFQIDITDSAGAAIPLTANVQVNLVNLEKIIVYLGPFATAVQQVSPNENLWDITIPGGFAAAQTGILLETPGSPDTSPLLQTIIDDENKLLIEVQADDVGSGFNETLHFLVTVDKGTLS